MTLPPSTCVTSLVLPSLGPAALAVPAVLAGVLAGREGSSRPSADRPSLLHASVHAPRTCRRPDLRAVLHDLVQRHQPLFAERCQYLREQFIQLFLLRHTEIRHRVVVHFLQARQPLERWIKLTPPRHLTR